MTGLNLKEKNRRPTQVLLSPAIVRAAKVHSIKYDGCPRPHEGSLSHYVWISVLHQLKKDGLDVEKVGWYKIPKIKQLKLYISQ